jgi:hypothetical protein
MEIKTNIEFGKRYRDKVNGFEGKATAYIHYLYGSNKVLLEGFNNHGDSINGWIVEERLEPVEDFEV